MRPRLRLFTGAANSAFAPEPRVSVRLEEMARILSDAVEHNRAWLDDFADDEVEVPADVFEVMTTYWRMRSSA
ncbi:hypothetical protein [Thalassoroseus pseudoceratinae]|uniref:hypothetical protein n=1 Tax=Thalassoroseus pseudoceratinae TaxID=2713176 RepID=UPI00141EB7FA|nr:hypothetical protein [Thalassoroseus pseudoceratinae]